MSRKRLTTEEFIERSIKVHNNRYQYPMPYINSKTKIAINCNVHGIFYQKPSDHLQGQGCLKCKIDKQRISLNDVILRARDIHGDKYDYPGPYVGTMSKMPIICNIHGEFWQEVASHLSGCGCPICRPYNGKSSASEFMQKSQKIHNNKYKYTSHYINARTKVLIRCPIHGEFQQTPDNHLHGQGCPQCATFRFDLNKPSVVYVVELKNNKEHFIKIGISNDKERRFGEIKADYTIITESTFSFITGKPALYIEQLLLDFNLKKYKPENPDFKGKTECFYLSEKSFIIDFIKSTTVE